MQLMQYFAQDNTKIELNQFMPLVFLLIEKSMEISVLDVVV